MGIPAAHASDCLCSEGEVVMWRSCVKTASRPKVKVRFVQLSQCFLCVLPSKWKRYALTSEC